MASTYLTKWERWHEGACLCMSTHRLSLGVTHFSDTCTYGSWQRFLSTHWYRPRMLTQVCVPLHWCSPVSHSLISAEAKQHGAAAVGEQVWRVWCWRWRRLPTLAQPGALQLVSFWAHTGKPPRLVDTLVLTQVAGVAALIDVWAVTKSRFRVEPEVEIRGKRPPRVLSVAPLPLKTNLSPLQAKPSGPSS